MKISLQKISQLVLQIILQKTFKLLNFYIIFFSCRLLFNLHFPQSMSKFTLHNIAFMWTRTNQISFFFFFLLSSFSSPSPYFYRNFFQFLFFLVSLSCEHLFFAMIYFLRHNHYLLFQAFWLLSVKQKYISFCLLFTSLYRQFLTLLLWSM